MVMVDTQDHFLKEPWTSRSLAKDCGTQKASSHCCGQVRGSKRIGSFDAKLLVVDANRYPGLKNSGEYVAVWDSATQHDLHWSDVWRSFRGGYWHKNPPHQLPVTICIWNKLYSWNSWWVFLNHFNIFFDALRHESHNRAIRIDLQKRSALGWNIFFQGGRMPKGSTKRCIMHVHMSVCFVYVLYISYAGCFTFFVASSLKENKPSSKKLSTKVLGTSQEV